MVFYKWNPVGALNIKPDFIQKKFNRQRKYARDILTTISMYERNFKNRSKKAMISKLEEEVEQIILCMRLYHFGTILTNKKRWSCVKESESRKCKKIVWKKAENWLGKLSGDNDSINGSFNLPVGNLEQSKSDANVYSVKQNLMKIEVMSYSCSVMCFC